MEKVIFLFFSTLLTFNISNAQSDATSEETRYWLETTGANLASPYLGRFRFEDGNLKLKFETFSKFILETSGKGTLGLKTEFYYSINEIDVYNIDFVTLQATNPNFPAGFILILRGITTFKWGQTNESSLNAAKQECLSLGYEEGSSSHIFFKNKEDGRRVFKAFKRLFELLEKDAKFEDKTAIEDKF